MFYDFFYGWKVEGGIKEPFSDLHLHVQKQKLLIFLIFIFTYITFRSL